MPTDTLSITGARQHNLRSVDLDLPKDSLVVLTGVSGSGKSSLAFDTIYAEGQRRYVESLSSYARQFLGQTPKPDVDGIEGLAPAISIEQKGRGHNPRSTVGTVTEIYDYLRVLYAAIGRQHCPECGTAIGAQTVDQIVARLLQVPDGARLYLMAPVAVERKGEFRNLFDDMRRAGYVRARVDGEYTELTADLELDRNRRHSVSIVVDRGIVGRPGFCAADRTRITEGVENAVGLADGGVQAAWEHGDGSDEILLSTRYSCETCGVSYAPPTHVTFSFNTPHGMCKTCDGLGSTFDFDPEMVVADPSKSIDDTAMPLMPHPRSWYRHIFQSVARHYKFKTTTPVGKLTAAQRKGLFYGSGTKRIEFRMRGRTYARRWEGVMSVLMAKYKRLSSEGGRKRYQACMQNTLCPDCGGGRLNAQALAVMVGKKSIADVCAMSIADAQRFFDELSLSSEEALIAEDALKEIRGRLGFLMDVGLHYLSLGRTAPTLSGGESQRIRLASQVGSGLVGVLYILDEPSIGLHNRDNARLLQTLQKLRDRGNTVVVVEHDEDTMLAADHIVDFGPGAGERGGEAVVSGSLAKVLRSRKSLTGRYLRGELEIPIPAQRRQRNGKKLTIRGARQNNLKNIDVDLPLGQFICVTGVSGSGKSSLVNDILYQVLARDLNRAETHPGRHRAIEGLEYLDKVISIDQSPIGRTPRSNPATYVGVFDHIRKFFAELPESRLRGYAPGRFSFNVKGGRCEACEGNGAVRLEMDFLADVWVECEVCGGTRFNKETLEVAFKDRSIAQVLDMDIAQAVEHFAHHPKIAHMLGTLHDVGMDYVRLGQPAPTLSGGEAQRVKLASELCRKSTGRTLYILDEPTTGLHFADIHKLLDVLHHFVDQGNTVVVVEHNLEVIKTADHVIDLGPEGGADGGRVVVSGTPEQVAKHKTSHTGEALRSLLHTSRANRLATARKAASAPRRKRTRCLEHVLVRGGREHNLRGVDTRIPREKLSVFSGPSGSGKSSLALDTIYAEGQRRYIGSLSAYARQFLGQLHKPSVDMVDGLSPAICIEQRITSHSPRSTVGTVTEVYDYLRALYARVGVQHCPECGIPVGARASSQIIDRVVEDFSGRLVAVLAPITLKEHEEYADVFARFTRDGYRRVRFDGDIVEMDAVSSLDRRRKHTLELVVDRVKVSSRGRGRVAEAVEQALQRSGGWLVVSDFDSSDERTYSQFLSCPSCWRTFDPVVPKALSFNHAEGWCPTCEGVGVQRGANPHVLIPDEHRTIREGAVEMWGAFEGNTLLESMVTCVADQTEGLDLDTPWKDLPAQARQTVLYGSGDTWFDGDGYRFRFKGLFPAVEEASRMSGRIRRQVERVVRDIPCTVCEGNRLNPVGGAVKLRDLSLPALCALPLEQVLVFLENLLLDGRERERAGEVLEEIRRRVKFLVDVGLEYVTLGRGAPTLSGGESQRIRLAAQIGSGLTGVLYVLDEPTIGLHPRDNARLLSALGNLRDLGNTLIVVEHDRDTLETADHLVDFGPGAGPHGGRIVASGTPAAVQKTRSSLTGQYLAGTLSIPVLEDRRAPQTPQPNGGEPPEEGFPGWVSVIGARENNLADITVHFPLGVLVAVTGPSGSGKSSLVEDILRNHLAHELNRAKTAPGLHDRVAGSRQLAKVITIDQTPIGHGARSDPSTYTGVFDRIRELYSMVPEARVRGYTKRRFSYNHTGGRCEACWGLGQRRIEMHFLPDVWVDCDVCHGVRFNHETLEVKYRGRSIADVLAMSIEDAAELFNRQPKIARLLGALIDVGLGYMHLGQPASTLSGGEAQRVKLARELARPSSGQTIYLLDEPTTGLHVSDVQRLMAVLHRLVEAGNSVVVIEHNMEVVKSADWVIDLGPGGGEHGGRVVASGAPEVIARCRESSTAPFLRDALERSPRISRVELVGESSFRELEAGHEEELGADVQAPWESDGIAWHTKLRTTSRGRRAQWQGDALVALVEQIQALDPTMVADWNNRETVTVKAEGSRASFLRVVTNEYWWFRAVFRTKRRTWSSADRLRKALPLPSWDDVKDLQVYGRWPRVNLQGRGDTWDEMVLFLWCRKDVQSAAFRKFLKAALEGYKTAVSAPKKPSKARRGKKAVAAGKTPTTKRAKAAEKSANARERKKAKTVKAAKKIATRATRTKTRG